MSKNTTEVAKGPCTEFDEVLKTENRVYMFFADGMNIGGIETLLVRMANQISRLGYSVIVVAHDGPCMQSLDKSVTVFKTEHGPSSFSQFNEADGIATGGYMSITPKATKS